LKVMQNRVLGRIFGVNRQKAGGDEKDWIMMSFITWTYHRILWEWSNRGGWDGRGM
jgi:hypothetical protein